MKKAFTALVIIFIINVLSLYYGWDLKWAWFDVVMHFSGGLFVAMLMAVYLKEYLRNGEIIKNVLIVVGATVFIGVVWEFAEYLGNQTLTESAYHWFGIRTYFMGDLDDTIIDLMMDTLGALAFISLHSLWRRYSHKEETLTQNYSNS